MSTAVLPVVAVVGRPNVGKSTLVNRIVGKRVAIVEEHPGVTRDRLELASDWRGRDFTLVDTGGVVTGGDDLDTKVTEQAWLAIRQADVVLFVLDVATGPTAEDEQLAGRLLRSGIDVIPVANKADSPRLELDAWELARLGLGEPVAISALHGRGIGDLLDLVVDRFPAVASDDAAPAQGQHGDGTSATTSHRGDAGAPADEGDDQDGVGGTGEPVEPVELAAVAIVGRPNVGKSTLFNRLVGEDRSIVHDVAGTTRDAIDTVVDTEEGRLRFIDTAGLRRRARTGEAQEYYSLVRSLAAIDRADVSLLVIDAAEGVSHQDQRLAERIDAAGSPIVIICNKMDAIGTERRLELADEIEDRLGFITYAPVLRISAKTGLGVQRLLPALRQAIDAYHRRVPTAKLNEAVKLAQGAHPAPGARVLYAVQGAVDPPTVTLFATKRLTPDYLRYLERSLREHFALGPTPLKLRVRVRGT